MDTIYEAGKQRERPPIGGPIEIVAELHGHSLFHHCGYARRNQS